MADVTETYSLNFETNAQKATGLVSELEKTLSAMGDSGELATKGLNSASRGVLSIEKALGGASHTLAEYNKDLRKTQELANAKNSLAGATQDARWSGMDKLSVATEKAAYAQNNLAAAQRAYDRLTPASSMERRITATNRLAVATRENTRAQESLGRATGSASNGFGQMGASLPTLRYAMYDVARTAGMMSTAITAAGAGVLAASASFESSFTAVERTSGVTGDAVGVLRDDLLDLSRTIPQSFGEISNLAARGAQLGVADTALAGFTETVAQFVATSDTVTLDQAVEAFGRVSNLLGDTDFNRIGSAITLVGVNAAATEGQIVKTTQELAPFAAAIGMSSDEVIGLATALASLGQPPERARSAFLSLQSVMEKAISGMNDKLPAFASLLNTSADEVENLWKTDPAAFIQSFVDALSKTENLTVALGDLGLSEKRATQVFQALAADSANAGDGLSVLTQAFQDSEKGYREGTELARQYGLIVDDLASKWQLFINSVQEVAAALGDTLAPAAKVALDFLTNMLQGIAEVSRNPFAKWVHGISLAVVGLGGVFLALVASSALAVASMAAFKTALDQAAISSGTNMLSIRGLNAALTQTAVAAGVSSRALTGFKVALAGTGIGLAVVALGTLAAAFMNAGQTAEQAFESYVGSTGGLSEALAADQLAYQEALATGNTELAGQFIEIGTAATAASTGVDANSRAMQDAADLLGVSLEATESVTGAIEEQTSVMGENTLAWLNNSLIQSEAFQALAANQDFVDSWEEYGLTLQEVIRAAADGGESAVLDLFIRMGRSSNNGAGVFLSGWGAFFERTRQTLGAFFTNLGDYISAQWDNIVSGNFAGLYATNAAFASLNMGQIGVIWGTDTLSRQIQDFSKVATGAVNTSRELDKAARDAGKGMVEAGEGGEEGGGGVGGFGDDASRAAEKVRTLVDYANDLSSVWKRAFDIRFGAEDVADGIADSFQKLRDQAEDSAKKVRDLKDSIKSLSADKGSLQAEIGTLEHFLKVARAYGDNKRAAELEAELAKKRAELGKVTSKLSDEQKALKKEQDSQSKSLTGNTQAARDNREEIRGLVSQYQAQIEKLAASGLSQDELRRKTAALREDFIRQATQLGFNRKELEKYAKGFDDVAVAINNVPRNVTVKANTDPAIQALNEFQAKVKSSMVEARNTVGKGVSIPITSSFNGAPMAKSARGMNIEAAIAQANADLKRAISAGNDRLAATKIRQIQNWTELLNSGNYAQGGYTGPGGKYEPAGIVHKGEYVLRKDQVNQRTGLPYASALGQLMGGVQPTAKSASGGGSTGGAVGTVDLSAHTIQQLARVVQTNIMLDGRIVGEAASNSYAANTRVGAA